MFKTLTGKPAKVKGFSTCLIHARTCALDPRESAGLAIDGVLRADVARRLDLDVWGDPHDLRVFLRAVGIDDP
jgi:hypothetical protein